MTASVGGPPHGMLLAIACANTWKRTGSFASATDFESHRVLRVKLHVTLLKEQIYPINPETLAAEHANEKKCTCFSETRHNSLHGNGQPWTSSRHVPQFSGQHFSGQFVVEPYPELRPFPFIGGPTPMSTRIKTIFGWILLQNQILPQIFLPDTGQRLRVCMTQIVWTLETW